MQAVGLPHPRMLDISRIQVPKADGFSEIMKWGSIHQMAHLPVEKKFPPRYSRHYTDLAAMIEGDLGKEASRNEGLLAKVVAHKTVFFCP